MTLDWLPIKSAVSYRQSTQHCSFIYLSLRCLRKAVFFYECSLRAILCVLLNDFRGKFTQSHPAHVEIGNHENEFITLSIQVYATCRAGTEIGGIAGAPRAICS